jgi:hypothetical protein
MVKRKFENNIIYGGQTQPPEEHQKVRTPGTELFYIHDGILKGAFMLTGTWMTAPVPGSLTKEYSQHMHDADEFLGLIGSDIEHPYELCGEAEFWFEDEKYTITKSCAIFIPKGTRHAPLIVTRVDRPIFVFSTTPDIKHAIHKVEGPQYLKKH